jgi:hypothetical protein
LFNFLPALKAREAAGKQLCYDVSLFGLFFNPEDGGNMSLCNVG